ncbi:MAG: rhodanese-like domain-containing protein [Janthinobacterium lividum]
MKFLTDYTNLALLVIAIVAGALLLWPILRRGKGLTAQDATQLINRRNAVVIDVRAADAFAAGHLPLSRHLEFSEVASKIGQVARNKKNPLLLVCESGQRSGKAEAILRDAGYDEVYSLQGGLNAWRQAGLPTVRQGAAK